MTRQGLFVQIAGHFPQLMAQDVEYAVKMILDMMTQTLQEGRRIEIRGFGSFDQSCRPARVGRNPKTGVKVDIPQKLIPHFKAGKNLRLCVDASSRLKPKVGLVG